MKSRILLLLIIALIASCSKNNNDYDKLIGIWKLDTVIDSLGSEKKYAYLFKPGLEFISTSQFRPLPGPVNISREEQTKPRELMDTIINFNILNNQIRFKSINNGKSITKKIIQINSDSLYLLDSDKKLIKYTRIFRNPTTNGQIDRIVLSSSGCYGSCPITDVEVYRNGMVTYFCSAYCGEEGFYEGHLSKSRIDRLFNFLDLVNLDTLQNDYSEHHTDDETITVSFFTGNNHVKTVSDYGRKAPTEFIWLYTYLRYIPGLKNLERNSKGTNLIDKPQCLLFSNNVQSYSFETSESYAIYSKLLNAEIADNTPELPYEVFNFSFPVQNFRDFIKHNGKPNSVGYTNGRFFKFKELNNQIFDLGYSSIDNKFKTN